MNNNRTIYQTPEIEIIMFDNEISLILTSEAPPDGPGESISQAPEYFEPSEALIG